VTPCLTSYATWQTGLARPTIPAHRRRRADGGDARHLYNAGGHRCPWKLHARLRTVCRDSWPCGPASLAPSLRTLSHALRPRWQLAACARCCALQRPHRSRTCTTGVSFNAACARPKATTAGPFSEQPGSRHSCRSLAVPWLAAMR
jgi:hypothetical protein